MRMRLSTLDLGAKSTFKPLTLKTFKNRLSIYAKLMTLLTLSNSWPKTRGFEFKTLTVKISMMRSLFFCSKAKINKWQRNQPCPFTLVFKRNDENDSFMLVKFRSAHNHLLNANRPIFQISKQPVVKREEILIENEKIIMTSFVKYDQDYIFE